MLSRFTPRATPALAALAIGLLSGGCGSGTAPAVVVDVVVSAPTDTLRTLGTSVTLSAVAHDRRGHAIPDANVTWKTSDPSVLSVDGTGVATAVGGGSAVVSASIGRVVGIRTMFVIQVPTSLVISAPPDTLRSIGDTARLDVVAKDSSGAAITSPSLSWTSRDPSVVIVDDRGLATAMANGSAVVVGAGGEVSDSARVVVRQRASAAMSVVAVVGPELFALDTVEVTLEARDARGHRLAFGGSTVSFSTSGGTSAGSFLPVGDNGDGSYTSEFLGSEMGTGVSIGATLDGTTLTSPAPTLRVVGFVDVSVSGLRMSSPQGSESGGVSCGVLTTGELYCWGYHGPWGIRGTGSFGDPAPNSTPTLVTGGHAWTSIADAFPTACGVADGGKAYCWGSDQLGALGAGIVDVGSSSNRATPTAVTSDATFAAVAMGLSPAPCALAADGSAFCWGAGGFGRLGNGADTSVVAPVAVKGGLHFAALSTSTIGTCGITESGSAMCWGDATLLGRGGSSSGPDTCGTHSCAKTPVEVDGGHTFRPVLAQDMNTVCSVTTDGQTYCWGSIIPTPTLLAGAPAFTSLASGDAFRCGVATGGAAYCWGKNADGQLGDGTTTDRSAPTPVVGGHAFVQLDASQVHTCGITTDGNMYCWGANDDGELGTRDTTPSLVPVRVRLFEP